MGLAPVHTIIVIESLVPNERNTGKELYDDVVVRYKEMFQSVTSQPLMTQYFSVAGKSEMMKILKIINHQVPNYPVGILIHIETHGSDDKNGLILNNDDFISWNEMQDALIEINVQTENQFYLSMATCFGRYIHEIMIHNLKSPFCAFISATEEIFPDEIVDNFESFFRELIKTRDAITAYNSSENESSKFYYKDTEEIYRQVLAGIKEQYDNPQFKVKFMHEVNEDLQKIHGDAISQQQFDTIFKAAFNHQVAKVRNNFLFGKGRGNK
jgi:hypothetical protein